MAMETQTKLGVGSALACVGAVGIVVGGLLGAGQLGRPWAFLVGFVLGVAAGIGCVLAISGLAERRAAR
jgi:F0F1-type ATP synthase assembly protein I